MHRCISGDRWVVNMTSHPFLWVISSLTAAQRFDSALNMDVTEFSAAEKDGKGGVVLHHAVGMN